MTNRLSGELAAEFAGAEKCLLEAAAIGERTGGTRMINLLSFFGSGESSPQDLTTVDGASVWAGDGVHLTSNASRVAARKLMADLANGGEEGGPVNKRARLESVVSTPAPAKKKPAAKGQPPTSPPRPVPPPAPLWLSRYAAARAAAAAAPTPVSGDRPEVASTAAGKIKTYHGPNHIAEL